MEMGNLRDFLRQERGKTLKLEDLVFIANQVADGMAHLEACNLIHRDLAARNVLLGENIVAKICDFGLARIIENEIYLSRGGNVPVKWTAPEALLHTTFTIKSDVWSYGIFLFELFTYGETPYGQLNSMQVFELVTSGGYRMPKPDGVPDDIYGVMTHCWHENPQHRPSFAKLEKHFGCMEVVCIWQDNKIKLCIEHNLPKSYEDHQINPLINI